MNCLPISDHPFSTRLRLSAAAIRLLLPALILAFCSAPLGRARTANPTAPSEPSAQPAAQSVTQSTSPATAAPIVVSLHDAITRAQASEPSYAAALADSRSASLDRSIARAGLLPSAVYHNQALYTQPNGSQNQAGQGTGAQPSPKFIANNAVREYASQGVINETFGLAGLAAVRRADAESARAQAELEIARRGLVATVTGLYYSVEATGNKLAIAQLARDEAADFTSLTQKREQGREAAHADVVKAQLLQQQRDRDLSDARLAADKARLELAVLLFPDPRTAFQVAPAAPRSSRPPRRHRRRRLKK